MKKAATVNYEIQHRVAYLGPRGTYCEEAAHNYFGDDSIYLPYPNFGDVMAAAERGETSQAVVAIENSTEGPVGNVHDLLLYTSLEICGEIELPIRHQMLVRSGGLGEIKQVTAHTQALAQCQAWLDNHLPGVERLAANSNAAAAETAARRTGIAAIAGRQAAQLYGLTIVASNIEDDPTNTTRFAVLGRNQPKPTGHDKTSLVCSVPNRPGSLNDLTRVLGVCGINMLRLHSRPARDGSWEYMFYIDVDGHRLQEPLKGALNYMRQRASYWKVLGSYPNAKSPI